MDLYRIKKLKQKKVPGKIVNPGLKSVSDQLMENVEIIVIAKNLCLHD